MPTVGTREQKVPGSGYSHDPINSFARSFNTIANSILTENKLDLYSEPNKVLRHPECVENLRSFFVEESADKNGMTAEDYEDHIEMMNEMFTNDKIAVLEHSVAGQFNPVIGMTFPIHKNIMLNNIFDKGAIPKFVATSPKITQTMETRWLIDPITGEKVDMFREQWRLTDMIEKSAPLKSMYLALPEAENTDILQTLFGTTRKIDHLSIESYVSGLVGSRVVFPGQTIQVVTSTTNENDQSTITNIEKYTNNTDTPIVVSSETDATTLTGVTGTTVVGAVFDWKGEFSPAYGGYDRQMCEQYALPCVSEVADGTLSGTWKLTVPIGESGTVVDNCTSEDSIPGNLRIRGFVSGFMKDDRFGLQSANAAITGCILTSRLDVTNANYKTASVTWSARTDIFEIKDRPGINTTISPEEVKDTAALYQVNQLTKVMSLIKTVMGNYKDDLIRRFLDVSFVNMPNDCKIARSFDFAPTLNYALDPLEWRYKTFMDALDTHVTQLIHVLNDPNMTINIIGRDDLIRKITPTDYTYQTPSSIGPVELDFVKTVVTSDKRTYQFISSDKLRDSNNLMIILCPRNSDRFIYRIYDYQMYLSNEIRNAENPTLPSVHAFERWEPREYQPVQGRLRILNPTGLRNYGANYAFNNDPIGRGDGTGVMSVGKNDFDIDR